MIADDDTMIIPARNALSSGPSPATAPATRVR